MAVPGSPERDADLSAHPFLVGLGPVKVNDDPLKDPFDVRIIQADQLRSPKSSGKSDEEERPITSVLEAAAH